MRKSNILIVVILAVGSVFFLWLWYFLQFNLIDNPLDLVVTIVWWAVIIAACVIISQVEKKRQERIRTAYISDTMLFNPEAGMVSTSQTGVIVTLAGVLESLKYNFDIKQLDGYSRVPSFKYIVTTSKFKDNGSTWEGEVASVARPNAAPAPFSSREELAALLA